MNVRFVECYASGQDQQRTMQRTFVHKLVSKLYFGESLGAPCKGIISVLFWGIHSIVKKKCYLCCKTRQPQLRDALHVFVCILFWLKQATLVQATVDCIQRTIFFSGCFIIFHTVKPSDSQQNFVSPLSLSICNHLSLLEPMTAI